MKRSFIAEKQEMQDAQEEALEDLQNASARPLGEAMEVEVIPDEVQQEWDTLCRSRRSNSTMASSMDSCSCPGSSGPRLAVPGRRTGYGVERA